VSADSNAFDLRLGVRIPLRDRIHLNATLYLPTGQREPGPCVVTLTPYISDSHHSRGVYFASRGVPLAIVDVRGRGSSEGTFRPNIQEARDGYDVVEWLARQPYCNGKVAMCGSSYMGLAQWATAKEFPPHLATIVPSAAPFAGVDLPMRNNIFYPYIVQWLTLTSGRASQKVIFSDASLWAKLFRRWHESGQSFRLLNNLVGNPSDIFQEWVRHPTPDAYWDEYNPSADQYARMELPILTITGSYDDDQPGALEHYKQHQRHAAPAARARHYLVIGPWDHARTGVPRADFGGLEFGAASVIDLNNLHLDWYAWTLGNSPRPAFLQRQVAYYVMGGERWRYADTLDAVTAGRATYYLNSRGTANGAFSSGVLTPVPSEGPPDSYSYDPSDVTGPEIDAQANAPMDSLLTDQTVLFALGHRQLVYHSEPFPVDTEISGFFKLRAWIAIDCPDTDLYVTLYEIGLDGSSIRLSTDGIRARYRDGLREPRLIRTRDPLLYEFDRFTFISREVKKGHRLRLVVAPIGRLIDTTFMQKNYNSGGVVAEESAADSRVVTVKLFHDAAHPSSLYVPLGQPREPGELDAGKSEAGGCARES
jgi:putative CocE/NonD family hydrolase